MTGLDVEAVLRDHDWMRGLAACRCGWEDPTPNWCGEDDRHRAHVAAVLRVEIESALADAWDAGYGVGHNHAETHAGWGPELVNPYRASLAATEGDRQ